MKIDPKKVQEQLDEIGKRILEGDTAARLGIEELLRHPREQQKLHALISIGSVATLLEQAAKANVRINEVVRRALFREEDVGNPYTVHVACMKDLHKEPTTLRGYLNQLYKHNSAVCTALSFVATVVQYPDWVPFEGKLAAAMEPIYFGSNRTFLIASRKAGGIRIGAEYKRSFAQLKPKDYGGWVMIA